MGENFTNHNEEKIMESKSGEIERLKVNKSEKSTVDTINILITNVSPVVLNQGEVRKRQYVDEEGNKFSGVMTNEAPIKSIMHRLGKRGLFLDYIIFIESEKVQTEEVTIENTKYKHFEYLQKVINDFLGEEYRNKTQYFDIDIKNEPSSNDVSTTVFKIYNQLLEWVLKEENRYKDIHIYIESNGGVRYVLTMLLSLTKTLENYYRNVHISEITSMVLNQNPVKIVNTKKIFDTAQITGIVDEFINYGRTNSLNRYVNEYRGELSIDEQEDIQKVSGKLNKLANDIQLCRTDMILEDLFGASNIKEIIEEYTKKYSSDNESAIVSIFKNVLDLILKELNNTIYRGEDNSRDPIFYLPRTIRWCLDKSFIQQALTFTAEKLPKYLFDEEIIKLDEQLKLQWDESDIGKYEKSYYFVANMRWYVSRIKNARINCVLNEIKKNCGLDNDINIDWKTVFLYSKMIIRESSDEIKEIAKKIVTIVNDFYSIKRITGEADIHLLLEKNRVSEADWKHTVHISNKIKSTLELTMCGLYEDNEGNKQTHVNLASKEQIIMKILPVLGEIFIDENSKESLAKAKKDYDQVINNLFPSEQFGDLGENLQNTYSEIQSKKYFIKDAMDGGFISSEKDLQKILYLYSLCKEQRNFSNHAHIAMEDAKIALDTEKLTIVINKLLGECTNNTD